MRESVPPHGSVAFGYGTGGRCVEYGVGGKIDSGFCSPDGSGLKSPIGREVPMGLASPREQVLANSAQKSGPGQLLSALRCAATSLE